MLVGPAGSGKSVLVGAKLASLDSEQYMVKNVPFNYYTTSAMLQGKEPWGVSSWEANRASELSGLGLHYSQHCFLPHPTHYTPCLHLLLTLPPTSFLPVP